MAKIGRASRDLASLGSLTYKLIIFPCRAVVRRTEFPNDQKPAENKFIQSDFTGFSIQASADTHSFRFRSSCSKLFKQENDLSISQVFNPNFGGVLTFGPTVASPQLSMKCLSRSFFVQVPVKSIDLR